MLVWRVGTSDEDQGSGRLLKTNAEDRGQALRMIVEDECSGRTCRWLKCGVSKWLAPNDQVGEENEGQTEGDHKAVKGRSSVKSLPLHHCDPPGRNCGRALSCVMWLAMLACVWHPGFKSRTESDVILFLHWEGLFWTFYTVNNNKIGQRPMITPWTKYHDSSVQVGWS